MEGHTCPDFRDTARLLPAQAVAEEERRQRALEAEKNRERRAHRINVGVRVAALIILAKLSAHEVERTRELACRDEQAYLAKLVPTATFRIPVLSCREWICTTDCYNDSNEGRSTEIVSLQTCAAFCGGR